MEGVYGNIYPTSMISLVYDGRMLLRIKGYNCSKKISENLNILDTTKRKWQPQQEKVKIPKIPMQHIRSNLFSQTKKGFTVNATNLLIPHLPN